MIYQADLHSHSTASDGQYTPTQVVGLARAAGVNCLALTDHDTLAGVDEAIAAGKQFGDIRVLRGVELGAKEDRHLHIVGLCVTSEPSELSRLCQKLLDSRDQRKYRIVDYLAQKGMDVPLEEVEELAGTAGVGRPHFAQVMAAHGYVKNTREAFDKYLDTDEFQAIERFKAPAADCIAAIHAAGGRAVLAHPYQLGFSDEQTDMLLAGLKDAGLDGLECYYRRHTPEQVTKYLAFAEKYGFHISSAGDFHGEKVHADDRFHPNPVDLDWLPVEG